MTITPQATLHTRPGPILAAVANDEGEEGQRLRRVARRIAVQREVSMRCLRVVEFHHGEHFSPAGCEIAYGDPAVCIGRVAREWGAQLVVVGIGRHRPLDRIFGADTALRTIQECTCPVLAVARGTEGIVTDVVVGTDFSEASLEAARDALAVASADATLHFVHVWHPTPDADDELAHEEAEHRAALPAIFRSFLARLDPVPAAATFIVREGGGITECLLDEAARRGASMIAVGRRGQNPLMNRLVGSVATRVLRASTRSVLVSPPVHERHAVAEPTAPPARAEAQASPR